MPTITVNGASIAYQVFGKGPLLVWTEGGRFGRNEFSYLVAGHFARQYFPGEALKGSSSCSNRRKWWSTPTRSPTRIL